MANQISELSQKYDYSLLMTPALIRLFKYEISIHRWIIISKMLFETKQSITVSIFVRLF